MGRPKINIVEPKIETDDIIKFAKLGGIDGVYKSCGYETNFSDDEQTYCMFMYALDRQLIETYGYNGHSLQKEFEGKSKDYINGYLCGRIHQIIGEYLHKFVEPAMLKKKRVYKTRGGSRADLDNFIIQYLLRINGFTLDTDVSSKDYNAFSQVGETVADSGGAIMLPIKFLGKFADEDLIKQSIEAKTGTDLISENNQAEIKKILPKEMIFGE